MRITVISFTQKGTDSANMLSEKSIRFQREKVYFRLLTACSKLTKKGVAEYCAKEDLKNIIRDCFAMNEPVVFVGACGIAVRMTAPFLKDKLKDVPVIVMDEKAQFVIPLLAGHAGGANELATEIAAKMKATPVITTATDVEGVFAVDVWAKKNNLHIENRDGIAKISSKILAGETVTVFIEPGLLKKDAKFPPGLIPVKNTYGKGKEEQADILVSSDLKKKNALLILRPEKYIIGIGCRKGKSEEEIEKTVREVLRNNHIALSHVSLIASVDAKKEEEGIVQYAKKRRIPYVTFPAEELEKVKGDFASSDFVKKNVGVDNVCERAAVLAGGRGCSLVVRKTAKDGVTVAVAERKIRVDFQ